MVEVWGLGIRGLGVTVQILGDRVERFGIRVRCGGGHAAVRNIE